MPLGSSRQARNLQGSPAPRRVLVSFHIPALIWGQVMGADVDATAILRATWPLAPG
jgi:hypothetical protein